MERAFCTTREAANLMGVSVSTVQMWAESGLLDAWKTDGGHRRISRESIMRLTKFPETCKSGDRLGRPPRSPDKSLNVIVVEDDLLLRRMYEVRLAA